MKTYVVEGGRRLTGEIPVSGAKNAALPIMAAALLTAEPVVVRNVPELRDVRTLGHLLEGLGCMVERRGSDLYLEARELSGNEAPYELVKEMRASVVVLGPLLARLGTCRVSLPGGCAIGERPVDQHLKGLRAMGAEIDIVHGYIEARSRGLKGARITLDVPTVTGTENLLMAAVLADGETIIENAAREPEVADLAAALVGMGAFIEGAGEDTIVIRGVKRLGGVDHRVIPDRVETATYLTAAMATGGEIVLTSCRPAHVEPVIQKLRDAGGTFTVGNDFIRVVGPARPRAVDLRTMPHPGFPTDMQAPLMTLMTVAEGIAVITESVFENRFQHAAELKRMGADIAVEGHTAVVRGVSRLSGAPVMASDLRAGAALVIAGLMAEGITTVSRIYHVERGYENMVGKLTSLGAVIREGRDV